MTANGDVAATGATENPEFGQHFVHGIQASSNGQGNITIGGSGTVSGQEGRGIYTTQGFNGTGSITITGTGDTTSGTPELGCCSTIRGEIDNPDNDRDIDINRSGNVTAMVTGSHPVMSAIHDLTVGTGNIVITDGVDSKITNLGLFGIDADTYGFNSSGSISVTHNAGSAINSGGTGIMALNSAFDVSAAGGSKIVVVSNGTINSGVAENPLGQFPGEGGGAPTTVSAGIMAGYNGGSVFGKPGFGP